MIVLGVLPNSNIQAVHRLSVYDFDRFGKYEVKGSKNFYKLSSSLKEDTVVTKEIKIT